MNTKETLVKKLLEQVEKDGWRELYRSKRLQSDGLRRSEWAAEWLLEGCGNRNVDEFMLGLSRMDVAIPAHYKVDRSEEKYEPDVANRRGKEKNGKKVIARGRDEDWISKLFVRDSNDGIDVAEVGKALDFQVVLDLNDKKKNIDLVSLAGDEIRLIELKRPDNSESLMRVMLEAYTYAKTLIQKRDGDEANAQMQFKKEFADGSNSYVIAAPTFFEGGPIDKQHEKLMRPGTRFYEVYTLLNRDLKEHFNDERSGIKFISIRKSDRVLRVIEEAVEKAHRVA